MGRSRDFAAVLKIMSIDFEIKTGKTMRSWLAKIGEKLISVSDTIKQLQQLIRFAESVVFGAIWKINKFPGADRIESYSRGEMRRWGRGRR